MTYEMTKKRLSTDQSLLKNHLRIVFTFSKVKVQALSKARKSRGKYQCARCRDLFTKQNVEVDHILGFDPKKKFDNLTAYGKALIERFFEEENLQVLCRFCHRQKTGGWE